METKPIYEELEKEIAAIRKKVNAERELSENKQIFYGVFEDSVDGMIRGDKNGNYLKVNKALSKLLGYSQEELLSMRT